MTQEEQNILSQLNDAQRQAVVYDDGPELVVAGAGSGKTRVLTYKIAWLLEHEQLKPWSVLALTFTNKAANGRNGHAICKWELFIPSSLIFCVLKRNI